MSGWKQLQERVWGAPSGAGGLLFGKHSQGLLAPGVQVLPRNAAPADSGLPSFPNGHQAGTPEAPKASGLFWMMMRVGRTREPASGRFEVKLLRKKSSYL